MVDANYRPQMGDIIKGNLSGLTYEVVGFSLGKVNFRIKGGYGDAGASLTAEGTFMMPERYTLIRTAGRKVEVGDIWKLNATGQEWEVDNIEGMTAHIRRVRDSTISRETVDTDTGSFWNDKAWTFVSSKTEKEAPQVKVGDRVRATASGRTGEAVAVGPLTVEVLWDRATTASIIPTRFLEVLHSPSAKKEPLAAQAAIDEIDKLRAVLIAEVEERQEKLGRLKAAKNRLMVV